MTFSSAAQALEALKTGASLQKSRQPASSRIRLKKSANKLVIKYKRGISLRDILHLLLSMLRSVKNLIIMFWPCIPLFLILGDLILSYSFLNIWSLVRYIILGKNSVFDSLFFIIFLGLIFMFCLNLLCLNRSVFTAAVLGELKSAAITCFGFHCLCMYRDKFILEKRLLIWAYSCSGSTSEIHNINIIPFKGAVILETKMKTYCFGEGLTNPEGEWLVEEIQNWLYSGLRVKD